MPNEDAAPAALAAYLAGRRWSGARGGALRVLGTSAPVPLFADPAARLVVAEVRVANAAPYELLLVAAGDDPTADATGDAAFRLALYDALRGARAFESADVVARDVDAGALPAATSSRVGTAEQSNTSIIYEGEGGAVMLKLFRRVEVGESPDVEIGRFLTRRGFAHVPRLYGTVALRRPNGEAADAEATVAMAQALVPGAEDAWAVATRAAAEALGGGALGAYAAEAGRLGAVTRALHDALAGAPPSGPPPSADALDPAFAPEPARYDDVRRWAQGALAAYDAMLAAAGAAGTALPGAVLDRAAAVERVDALAAEAADDAGAAIRHHGDYHLGQVLRAADGGLFVVDFEGEPARPLLERRRKHSPLRDVAGMLRSFAYAAAFAARGASGDDAAERADAWERSARDAFLAAYFGPGPAAYLPRARRRADALLALFETEKLYYELKYELSNRPDWVDIPLRRLARGRG